MEIDKTAIILDAASKIFEKYGYQKTSMDDIAREAMIGKGTIYYYFSSKEDIFIAVLEKFLKEMIENITEKINNADTFEEKFKIFFNEPHKSLINESTLMNQLWNADAHAFMNKLNAFKNETHDKLKNLMMEIFRYGVETGNINEQYIGSVEKIVNIIHGYILASSEYFKQHLSHQCTPEHYEDHLLFTDIFLNGLLKREKRK